MAEVDSPIQSVISPALGISIGFTYQALIPFYYVGLKSNYTAQDFFQNKKATLVPLGVCNWADHWNGSWT